MLMREVNPFPFLPATQAGTFISFDKKPPRAEFHLSVCMASMSFSGEENASRGYDGTIPWEMCPELLPRCPCCLQQSARTPLLLDPVSEMLPSRSFRGCLGHPVLQQPGSTKLSSNRASYPQAGLRVQQGKEGMLTVSSCRD